MSRLVLFYTKEQGKEKELIQICKSFNISTRKLKKVDLDNYLGKLIGMAGFKVTNGKLKQRAPKDYEIPEIMIFSDFGQDELDDFLQEYKSKATDIIKIKAVVTQYNVAWTLYQLTSELEKENISFKMQLFNNR